MSYGSILTPTKLLAELRRCNVDRSTAEAMRAIVRVEGTDAFGVIRNLVKPSLGCGPGPTFDCTEDSASCDVVPPPVPVPIDPIPVPPGPGPDPVPPGPGPGPGPQPQPPKTQTDAGFCQWVRDNLSGKLWFDIVLAVVILKSQPGSRAHRAAKIAQAIVSGSEVCSDKLALSWDLIIDLMCFATAALNVMNQNELEALLGKYATQEVRAAAKMAAALKWLKTNKIGKLILLIPGAWLVFCELYYMTWGHDPARSAAGPATDSALPPKDGGSSSWWDWLDMLPLPGLPPVLINPPTLPNATASLPAPGVDSQWPEQLIPPANTAPGYLPRYVVAPTWSGLRDEQTRMSDLATAYASFRAGNAGYNSVRMPQWEDWGSTISVVNAFFSEYAVTPALQQRIVDGRFRARKPVEAEIVYIRNRQLDSPRGLEDQSGLPLKGKAASSNTPSSPQNARAKYLPLKGRTGR